MQWQSDPPREWRASWAPGWDLLVCRNTTDTAWEWSISYKSGDGGLRAGMGGTADTPEQAKHAAQEAAECVALALREFQHHTKKFESDGPAPF